MTISTRMLIEVGRKRGIQIDVLSASKNMYIAHIGGKEYLWKATAFGGSISSARLIGDKALTHTLLQRWGFCIPEARVFHASEKDAAMTWSKEKQNVVFKPIDGSHGFGITVLPYSLMEREEAWDRVIKASKRGTHVQIEEYIGGEDYRFLVVGSRCVYVIERMPAAVKGDGKLSVRRLIDRENRRPARGKTRYASFYSPIELDPQLLDNLARGGMTLDSVPPEGEVVILRRVCNAGKGGTERDVTAYVSPEMQKEAIELARRLEMDVLAIDVRCPDIAKATSLRKDVHILELNATPGITLGMANWVADAVWDALLEKYQ
ncbi:hypothetical protein COW46_01005 [Candidatus Gracilibacteria bacterium CG17_big_fil_post_rev_8_21_14_2_50_48_13]|nr:MAG: hypothetical protein COW46_01005 [Candidatus Gracilibacteria bacterium CG17_big_fil_post_rev_8_21_14_2_50_48_13]